MLVFVLMLGYGLGGSLDCMDFCNAARGEGKMMEEELSLGML